MIQLRTMELQPQDLTIPEPGSTTARGVLSQAIRRLLGDLQRLPADHARTEEGRREYRRFRAAVASVLEREPGAVASMLRHPTFGVFVRVLRDRQPGGEDEDAMLGEMVAAGCLALAAGGVLPEPLRITRLPRRIPCPPLGLTLEPPPDTRAATFAAGSIVLETGSGELRIDLSAPGSEALGRPYHEVERPTVLALADNNPLAMLEAHPDKNGNAVDLGGRPVEEWVESLRSALSLIGEHLPALREEMTWFLQQVVPVGFDEHRHLSASYREAIGTIYLTLHPSPMTMAEAVIHEVGHNKLNALLEIDPLLDDAHAPLYHSPVRPDPRPLLGVLLAVHAFLPVARLYEVMRERGHPLSRAAGFDRRYEEIVAKNREGAQVLLDNAQPTATGRALLGEIGRLTAGG